MKDIITQIFKIGTTVSLSIDGFSIEQYKGKYFVQQESCCGGQMTYEDMDQAIEAFLLAKDLQ